MTNETHAPSAAWELLLPAVAMPVRARGRSLQSALREAVRSGRLVPGTRMPSSRDLARDLGVSRGLITEAYEQLAAEGYLRSGRGAGTWVGDAVRAAPPGAHDLAPRPAAGVRADFVAGSPDLSLFPRAAWAAAQRDVLAGLTHRGLGYPDPRGLPRLRTALAELLARRRGVVADPERVIVCSGVTQAVTLLGFVLRERGQRRIGVERPGSPQYEDLFAATGSAAVRIAMDADGLAMEALRASGVRTVVTTPSHHFPSGLAYSAARRTELLAWARGSDGLLVEDDYDGDFRYDRAPVGALQGLDPAHVAYAGSVSKSLAPGLRLGWAVVPDALAEEVVERKRYMDLGNPALDQATLARFIERGDYDRQLRRCQRAYKERRDALVTALGDQLPGTEVTGIAAGLHAIATLPVDSAREGDLLDRWAAAGVSVRALSHYGGESGARVSLVLGYAHLSPARITEGVRLLASVAREPDRPRAHGTRRSPSGRGPSP